MCRSFYCRPLTCQLPFYDESSSDYSKKCTVMVKLKAICFTFLCTFCHLVYSRTQQSSFLDVYFIERIIRAVLYLFLVCPLHRCILSQIQGVVQEAGLYMLLCSQELSRSLSQAKTQRMLAFPGFSQQSAQYLSSTILPAHI